MKAKYKVNKKAQISPVFKYIFMLVVGTIILIFFIRFAMKTEETGTEVIKAEVLHALDAAMQAFSVSEYSSGVIPTPPLPQMIHMQFGTGANCGKFTILGQKFFVPIERVIFGPSEMKMRQINAWTLAWQFPFKLTNIFYMMNSRSKYYLMYDDDNVDFVRKISSLSPSTTAFEMEHIPKSFDVKYVNSETEPKTKQKNTAELDMVKVNYFIEAEGSCPAGVSPNLKGSCIEISPECDEEGSENYKCYGTVQFFEGNKRKGASTFIGRSMMFGAILSDTYEAYECQYELALSELDRFIEIYKTKAKKLQIKKTDCSEQYSQIITMLESMQTSLAELQSSPTYENARLLSTAANSIKEYNEDHLAGDQDCEMLF